MSKITWTPEQQAEHRKLWVEALRSGKYQQAVDDLRDRTGAMCCLGVACEISGLGRWDGCSYVTEGDRHRGVLNPDSDMTNWLGLRSGAGAFGPSETGRESLAHLNDSGKTFAEIADIIESEPVGLIASADGADE